MTEALQIVSVFFGVATMVALPLFVLIGLPMMAWVAGRWIHLKERELELRRLEVATRVRDSLLLPSWVDSDDPDALLAWASTNRELARLDHRARH